MARVRFVGEEVLRKKCEPVTVFDDELKATIVEMQKTMKFYAGIGIAANQIGISKSICLIQISPADRLLTIINPEIIAQEEEITFEEGCLSIPGVTAKTKRFNKITVTFQDETGANHLVGLSDKEAIAMQHEMDHLNGKLYVDQLTSGERALLIRKHQIFVKQHTRRRF